MGFFRRNIEEIGEDRALRWYGVALALVNALTALHWLVRHPLNQVLDPKGPAICWPFFENCHVIRVVGPGGITAVVWGLLLLALLNAGLFADRRFTTAAYWLLAALSIYKGLLLFQDYRLRLNQHYMAYWTALVFLFLPEKRRALQYLIVLFYFWAGLLKFNTEWISGVGLYGRRPLGLPEAFIPASCVYVIVLEVLIVFGLFAQRSWIFWTTLAQLILFHIASFWVVGFFYPILMFLLLSLFVLARRLAPAVEAHPPGLVPLRQGGERRSTYALLAAFCLIQFVPLAFRGDSSLTGEGRLFVLHMFDAPTECRAFVVFRGPEGEIRRNRMRAPFVPERIKCDPIVYFNLARRYCRQVDENGNLPVGDIEVVLQSRKKGGTKLHTIVDIENFCATNPTYHLWRHNEWIHPPGEHGAKASEDGTAENIDSAGQEEPKEPE